MNWLAILLLAFLLASAASLLWALIRAEDGPA